MKRTKKALLWVADHYGENILDQTYLDQDVEFERYLVIASRNEGSFTEYEASDCGSLSVAANAVKVYADDGCDVDVYDIDEGRLVPVHIRHQVTLG